MIRRLVIAAAVLLGSTPAFAQNYQATQGSGTTFGSKLVSAVNYPQIVFCDPTTPSQCAVVDSSGIITIKVASGGIASGALASGSIAAGAMVDLLTMRGTVAAGTAASNSLLAGGVYNSTPITLTNTQQSALQFDVNGYLKTNVTNTNANGQATAANSSPVVVAKNSGTGSTVAGAAVGTAGTASTEVVTIQGIASGTNVPVSAASGAFASGSVASGAYASGSLAAGSMVDLLTVIGTKAAGTASTSSLLAGGVFNSAPPTLTNGQQAAVQMDSSGNIRANVNVASGGIASGAVASGAIASGAIASGAVAAGALAAGAGVDGWDLTQGAKADSVCATDTGTCSIAALMKKVTANLTTLNTTAGASVAAGTNYIGKTRATDGTNDAVLDPCQTQARSYGSFNISTATTTRIATEVSAKKIYICSIHMVTAAANNVALIEGTGSSCSGGTPAGLAGGTTAASGWNFSANGGISIGNGSSSVFANGTNAYSICLVSSAATQLSGNISYVSQ